MSGLAEDLEERAPETPAPSVYRQVRAFALSGVSLEAMAAGARAGMRRHPFWIVDWSIRRRAFGGWEER